MIYAIKQIECKNIYKVFAYVKNFDKSNQIF